MKWTTSPKLFVFKFVYIPARLLAQLQGFRYTIRITVPSLLSQYCFTSPTAQTHTVFTPRVERASLRLVGVPFPALIMQASSPSSMSLVTSQCFAVTYAKMCLADNEKGKKNTPLVQCSHHTMSREKIQKTQNQIYQLITPKTQLYSNTLLSNHTKYLHNCTATP